MNEYGTSVQIEQSAKWFWYEIYLKAFPNILLIEDCHDKNLQLMGKDRFILNGSKILTFDEKVRDKSRIYPDILLEYISNNTKQTPGWIEKNLEIDFIAYGWPSIKLAIMLPWQQLKTAWMLNKENWKRIYKCIPSNNYLNGTYIYTTYSIAVPLDTIFKNVPNYKTIILD